MADFVELEIAAHLVDVEAAKRDAEDLAWDHAKMAAEAAGVALASEPFEFLFKELRTRYLVMAEYLEFMTFSALVLVRSLLNSGEIQLTAEKPMDDTELANVLGTLSQQVVSSYAWLLAGQDLLWPSNKTMKDTGVLFRFPSSEVTLTQQES